MFNPIAKKAVAGAVSLAILGAPPLLYAKDKMEYVKAVKDFGKGIAFAVVSSSTATNSFTASPVIPNTIIGEAYTVTPRETGTRIWWLVDPNGYNI